MYSVQCVGYCVECIVCTMCWVLCGIDSMYSVLGTVLNQIHLLRFFVGRARVGPVIREEAANVSSQAVKSTK